jgi:hypothetical protein
MRTHRAPGGTAVGRPTRALMLAEWNRAACECILTLEFHAGFLTRLTNTCYATQQRRRDAAHKEGTSVRPNHFV